MTIADRLARLEAREAIADLVHAYALAVRRDRPEDIAGLFASQGSFELREGAPDTDAFQVHFRFESPEALVAYLASRKGNPHPVPMIHNLMVAVAGDGETATASSLMVGPMTGTGPDDRSHTGNRLHTFGEYADRFVRQNGQWLFAARIFTLFRPAI